MMDYLDGIDYLVVGHICLDLMPGGMAIGGAAAYAGATAHLLGCRTAVVTSAALQNDWQLSLPDLAVHQLPAKQTTTFENIYTANGRQQKLHARADNIEGYHIPENWLRAKIVHLGPIANEVDPQMIDLFSDSLIGLTPQGWLRHWDNSGWVSTKPWPAAQSILPRAAVTILSLEDLEGELALEEYRHWSRILVLTQGADGCMVYFGEEKRHFPAPQRPLVDTTGAGDIFSAAFLVRMQQTGGNPWEAARFANEIAALSITASGLNEKMATIGDALARERGL